MSTRSEIFLLFLLSYLVGSIPFGLIVSRIKGVDPRRVGSGNIGATNVSRAAGKVYGLITLVLDMLKGGLPVLLARYLGLPDILSLGVGFLSFLGHLFPFYIKFKGGKGVATAFGVLLFFHPISALLSLLIFLLVFYIWRYVSLSSIISSLSFPFILYYFSSSKETLFLSLIFSALIICKHRANIIRLRMGMEPRFGLQSLQKSGKNRTSIV